jgi:hypothetical protein
MYSLLRDYFYGTKESFETELIFHTSNCEQLNCNNYKVFKTFDNKDEAADLLDKINNNLLILIDHIVTKYSNINRFNFSPEKKHYLHQCIIRMKTNYRPNNIQENLPYGSNTDTSYTINKGEIFALCLRYVDDKDKFHNFNTIMFVAIHELAHLFTESYGHEVEFWKNFKFLLIESVEIGIYNPVDYSKKNVNYCSVNITYNPYYDEYL